MSTDACLCSQHHMYDHQRAFSLERCSNNIAVALCGFVNDALQGCTYANIYGHVHSHVFVILEFDRSLIYMSNMRQISKCHHSDTTATASLRQTLQKTRMLRIRVNPCTQLRNVSDFFQLQSVYVPEYETYLISFIQMKLSLGFSYNGRTTVK